VELESGVPASAQRLLCRGRVLADETSMESARVEDGDTLLLVQRAPDGANAEGNPNLARDPHAPDNVESRGAASVGHVGDLTGILTQLLANAGPMVGGIPGHAMTLEFSIGGVPSAGLTFGYGRGDGEDATAPERAGSVDVAAATATGGAAAEVNSEEVLRRFVSTLERTIEAVREGAPEMPPPAADVGAAAAPAGRENVDDGGATHFGVQCDACSQAPVRGSRYKSVAHEDFDLCQACFTSGRGAACGPFARLDLPLPSGLPPIVVDPNADDADVGAGATPRERSEVALGGLGEILRSAAALARASAPLLDDIADRYSPDTRANTVETQARGLQLAAVMQSVGSLWCELARAISVVPPPPGTMTEQGALLAGDDVNAPRSVFTYPRLAHISPTGAFPHTRPPGMPLHNSSNFVNGAPAHPQGRFVPAGIINGGVHIISAGPEFEGVEHLPPSIQNLLRHRAQVAGARRQQQTQRDQPAHAVPSASAAPPEGELPRNTTTNVRSSTRAPPTTGDASATQGHETHSNRALSRFLGSMLRVIPSPSFGRTAAPRANVTQRAREVHSMLRHTPPTTTTTNANANATENATTGSIAAGEASPSSPTRRGLRRRASDQNEAEGTRAAKSSKVDDEGTSPAAAAGSSRGTENKDTNTEE